VIPSPGAGAILGIVETRYVNAVEQNISLSTDAKVPGQNYILIQMFEAAAHSSSPGGLQDIPLSNLDMAGEARGTVGFADMQLSPYFVQNAYGPFGYSIGRTELGDLCMYAWQRIAADLKPGGGTKRGAINLRALVCDARKTEQDLLQFMLQLRIKGVTGLARRASTAIGTYGVVLTPGGMAVPGNVLPDPPAKPARVNRSVVPDEIQLPSGSGTRVPGPANRQPLSPAVQPPEESPAGVPLVPLPSSMAPGSIHRPAIAASI
jgi:hypothetical protein